MGITQILAIVGTLLSLFTQLAPKSNVPAVAGQATDLIVKIETLLSPVIASLQPVHSVADVVNDLDGLIAAISVPNSGVPANIVQAFTLAKQLLDPFKTLAPPTNADAIAGDIAVLVQEAEATGVLKLDPRVMDVLGFIEKYPALIADIEGGSTVQVPVGFSVGKKPSHAYVVADDSPALATFYGG